MGSRLSAMPPVPSRPRSAACWTWSPVPSRSAQSSYRFWVVDQHEDQGDGRALGEQQHQRPGGGAQRLGPPHPRPEQERPYEGDKRRARSVVQRNGIPVRLMLPIEDTSRARGCGRVRTLREIAGISPWERDQAERVGSGRAGAAASRHAAAFLQSYRLVAPCCTVHPCQKQLPPPPAARAAIGDSELDRDTAGRPARAQHLRPRPLGRLDHHQRRQRRLSAGRARPGARGHAPALRTRSPSRRTT